MPKQIKKETINSKEKTKKGKRSIYGRARFKPNDFFVLA